METRDCEVIEGYEDGKIETRKLKVKKSRDEGEDGNNAHRRVTSLLSPFHVVTHRQKNLFFDGAASELSECHAVLRLYFYGDDERCVVSLKARAVLVDSVSRVEEDEENLDPRVGRECFAEPGKLGSVEYRVLRRVKEEFGTEKGFRIRRVWKKIKRKSKVSN